jgi:Flp pilus assembly protein TadG
MMTFQAPSKAENRPAPAQAALLRFAADRRGNVAMMFSLCAVAMLGLVGVALDFSRTMMARDSAQNAVDAASLAAAELQSRGGASISDLRDLAASMVAANQSGGVEHVCAAPVLTRNVATGRVSIDMACDTPTTLSALLGFPKLSFTVASTAEYARTKLDVAMMLDVTGSMSGQKLKDLKAAAKLLVDTVVDPTGKSDDVRVALAPFSASVNAGGYFFKATNVAPGAVRCVTERTGGQAYTDAAPGAGAYSPVGPNNCPGAAIVPLSYDPGFLKTRIDGFNAGGMTAGHLGVAWARYLIAPKWSGVWPSASAPLAYGDPRQVKAVILMTDGEFNTQYSALGSSAQQARRHCDAMKADGVIVYAVAFQAGGASEALLKDCASSAGTYFKTSTGAALQDAYREIGLQLRRLRISR